MQLVCTMFISNNRASFHLWWKENLLKHQKVSKYYESSCNNRGISNLKKSFLLPPTCKNVFKIKSKTTRAMLSIGFSGVYRTLSNIYDEVFFTKIAKIVAYFRKKSRHYVWLSPKYASAFQWPTLLLRWFLWVHIILSVVKEFLRMREFIVDVLVDNQLLIYKSILPVQKVLIRG